MRAMQTSRMFPTTLALPGLAKNRHRRVAKLRILYAGPLAILTAVAATTPGPSPGPFSTYAAQPGLRRNAASSGCDRRWFLCAMPSPSLPWLPHLEAPPAPDLRDHLCRRPGPVLNTRHDDLSEPVATPAGVVALMVLHAVAAVAVVYPSMALTRDA